MSGQVLGFTGSAHQAAFALLPWLVNGTLDAGEQAQVEQHLQVCATCRRERAWLAQLAGVYSQAEVPVDADGAFARLACRLDDRAPARERADAGRVARLGRWLTARIVEPRRAWLRFAAAMQLGIIVALGWVLVAGLPADYRTLGAKHGIVREAGSLVVVFEPTATARDVSRILRSARARVVDGPTTQGAYVLAVDDAPGAIAAALERLRSEPSVQRVAPLALEPVR